MKNERWVIKVKIKSDIKNSRDKPEVCWQGGVALLDPKVMDDLYLSTGDIIELSEEEPLN